MSSDWIILRTSGRHTIKLTESLNRDGLTAWTPVHVYRRRAVDRKTIIEITEPFLASFVFAQLRHLHELLSLSEELVKPYPDFSVFRHFNEIPVVVDQELAALRQVEEQSRRRVEGERRRGERRRKIRFSPGEKLRMDSGAFAGMDGIVEKDDGRFVLVCFGKKTVKIDSFHLPEETISCPSKAA